MWAVKLCSNRILQFLTKCATHTTLMVCFSIWTCIRQLPPGFFHSLILIVCNFWWQTKTFHILFKTILVGFLWIHFCRLPSVAVIIQNLKDIIHMLFMVMLRQFKITELTDFNCKKFCEFCTFLFFLCNKPTYLSDHIHWYRLRHTHNSRVLYALQWKMLILNLISCCC